MARPLAPEKPYTPLDDQLLNSVLTPTIETASPANDSEQRSRQNGLPNQRRPSRRAPKPRPAMDEDGMARQAAPTQVESTTHTDRQNEAETGERMDATLRLKVATRDKREFEAFTARLAAALNTTLKPSNLLRAMLTVMQNAEPLLGNIARREPPMKRPPNDDAFAYAEFEHRLVRLIDSAIHQSTPTPAMRTKA